MNGYKVLPVKNAPPNFKVDGHYLYKSQNPQQPELGDVRIVYEGIESGVFSIAAQQKDNSLVTFNDRRIQVRSATRFKDS